MYPNLTAPLLIILGVAAAVLTWLLVRQPVLRWLAARQLARRRTEAVLVIAGSALGTAIIVGALVVGDTLGSSVRQEAYRQLGPIDERVVSISQPVGAQAAARLNALARTSKDIDGVITAQVDQAAARRQLGSGGSLAEPRVLAWDVSFSDAARFGSDGGPSGLSGAGPAPGHVVVNQPLADALKARAGDSITLYVSGRPASYVIGRVVAERGMAGAGFGASVNRNVFLPPGTLQHLTTEARTVTFVSNRGGVQSANALTARVTSQIRGALGPLATQATVETPKRDVLRAADKTGASLGALFLMIGSFSIIAGALLLVNIFVMLAEERKGQLGMLRAAGMKRSHLVGAFTLEGAAYAAVATIVGVGVGVGVGRGVAYLAGKIFSSWSADGNGVQISFTVTPTSLVNGAALGLVIALGTILATSIRISRFNIIASIRDLQVAPAPKARRRVVIVATVFAVLFAIASVPAVASSQSVNTFLLPSLSMFCLTPLLTMFMPKRWAYSVVSSMVLVWTLLANVLRPAIFDTPSMAVFVVLGSLLAFSAVVLVSENQSVLLRPFRRLIDRPSENALAGRLAVAYPTAKKFRTGATLSMYTLVVLVLVLLNEIGGVITKSIDSQVASATAGYSMRVDFNPSLASGGAVESLLSGRYRSQIARVAPLMVASARSTDPGHRTTEPVDTVVVGVPTNAVDAMEFSKRLPGLRDDASVWQSLALHQDYVVVDNFFAATGGPAGAYYEPGDTFTITDPRSGIALKKTIAGILRNGTMFYSPLRPTAYPAIEIDAAVRAQFGAAATVSTAFLQTAPGTSPDVLAGQLQGSYLSASLVATPMASTIRRMFNANFSFFRIMQGFLALGLVVGITGLGVVMVRAVRERRRTIGILRALGFRSRTIQRSFLFESGFVALEGVVLGSVLGLLTTWLMYQKSASFDGLRNGFPILWQSTLTMCAVTLIASLLATLGPARRAAKILPALATRVAE